MANGPSVRLLGECGVTRSFGVVCFLTFQISVSFTVLIGATVYNIIVKSMICKTIVLIKYTAF